MSALHSVRRTAAIAALVALPATSIAQDTDDDPAPGPVVLKHVPPRFSWNAGLVVSYGMRTQFKNALPWMGVGVRGGWGKHFSGGDHRVGWEMGITLEGEIAVQWSNNFEPAVTWDYVHPKGLFLGASLGPSLILNTELEGLSIATSFDIAPMAAFRIGYSQRFSLVARRFFVAVEPRLRVIDGQVNVIGAIVIGAGNGY